MLQLDRDAVFTIDGRATPLVLATIADSYPKVSLCDIAGYSGIGDNCTDSNASKYMVRTDDGLGFDERCPGDSGAPYFLPDSKVLARIANSAAVLYKRALTADETAARTWIRAGVAEAATGTMSTE